MEENHFPSLERVPCSQNRIGLGGMQEGLGHAMKHGHHLTSSTGDLLSIQQTTSACHTRHLVGIMPSDDTEEESKLKKELKMNIPLDSPGPPGEIPECVRLET